MPDGAGVWLMFSVDPRRPEAAGLKATDADRDLASDALREAYADGRLTRAEYDERSSSVLGVRTIGGFVPLLADLVPGAAEPAVLKTTDDLRAQAILRYRRDLADARNGWAVVSGVCLTIWVVTSAISGGLLFFWPVFPIIGVGLGYAGVRLNAESRIEAHEEQIAEARRARRRRRHERD